MDFGVFLEPALVLLMGVEIVEDDVKLAVREGVNKGSPDDLFKIVRLAARAWNIERTSRSGRNGAAGFVSVQT